MIKAIVKSHSLRDIILDFDDALAPPKFDQVARAQYYKAHDLYHRYDVLSVHTVSPHDDHQYFLRAYGDVEKEYFAYTDFANLVFEKYAHLVSASDKLYRRLELVEAKLKEKLDENPGESL